MILMYSDPDAGRDWGKEDKGMTEDEMAGWNHRLDGHEFEWIPGVGDGQRGLVWCHSWGRKEPEMTEQLNWTELKYVKGVSQVVLVIKNLHAHAGDTRDMSLTPGSGRSPGEEHGNPLQYPCLENPMDRGAWRATIHWVAKNWTWLKWFSMQIAETQGNF